MRFKQLDYGWTRVADLTWIHDTRATLHIKWIGYGWLESHADIGLYAHKYTSNPYCGPAIEFRYCGERWSYNFNYPARADVVDDLFRDIRQTGILWEPGMAAGVRYGIKRIEKWGESNGYERLADGLWRAK